MGRIGTESLHCSGLRRPSTRALITCGFYLSLFVCSTKVEFCKGFAYVSVVNLDIVWKTKACSMWACTTPHNRCYAAAQVSHCTTVVTTGEWVMVGWVKASMTKAHSLSVAGADWSFVGIGFLKWFRFMVELALCQQGSLSAAYILTMECTPTTIHRSNSLRWNTSAYGKTYDSI